MLGLAQAARSWDPRRGASFERHAATRIRGALLDDLLPSGDRGPDHVLVDRERRANLSDAVLALPERLRAVVIGYFYQERPMLEIAAELGVTSRPSPGARAAWRSAGPPTTPPSPPARTSGPAPASA
jgi:DNA-directed RNA polymerase specialized sigma subunit